VQIRLGVVTGLNLAEMCRLRCATPGFAPAALRHTPRCMVLHATCGVASPARAAAVRSSAPGLLRRRSIGAGLRGGRRYPRVVAYTLWAMTELAIVGSDIQEVGCAATSCAALQRRVLRCNVVCCVANVVCCVATSCTALQTSCSALQAWCALQRGVLRCITNAVRRAASVMPEAVTRRGRTFIHAAVGSAVAFQDPCQTWRNVMHRVAT
jgi:Mn2+/Fe2+ NRAMP family transporter